MTDLDLDSKSDLITSLAMVMVPLWVHDAAYYYMDGWSMH